MTACLSVIGRSDLHLSLLFLWLAENHWYDCFGKDVNENSLVKILTSVFFHWALWMEAMNCGDIIINGSRLRKLGPVVKLENWHLTIFKGWLQVHPWLTCHAAILIRNFGESEHHSDWFSSSEEVEIVNFHLSFGILR